MKILDVFIDNMTKIFRVLCSICWGIIGVGCLYTDIMLWNFSLVKDGNPIGTDVYKILGVVVLLVTVLFLLYAVRQAKKESGMALVRFLEKKVANVVLTVLTYGVLILFICSFTVGADSLRNPYNRVIQIAGGLLLLLDLCVNLGLFPDRWEQSVFLAWIQKKIKKKNR